MADCSDGGERVNAALLPNHMTLDSLLESEQGKEESSADETSASILGDILEMEGTETGEEDASLMEALAECAEKDRDEDNENYESDDEEEDEEDEGSDDEEEEDNAEDEEDDQSEEEEEAEEFDLNKGTDEAIEFGEMPDFSSMMEDDGSLLEGSVSSDVGLKALQETELMEADSNEIKSEPGTSSGKGNLGKKVPKKRKRKISGKVKEKRSAKKSKKDKKKKKKGKKSVEDAKVDPSTLKPSERRRNIRKIIGEKDLEQETLAAQKDELDRQKRIMELKKHAMSSMATASKPTMVSSGTGTSTAFVSSSAKEQDSQLKSLLQSAEEEAEKQEKKKAEISVMTEIKKEVQVKQEKVDVIELSSDSEDESNEDDCVMVPSTEDEDEEDLETEDLNDGGAHINDEYNLPDVKGRVLVNVGHPSDDPDIFLSPQVAKAIKPHQIGGVRFLYDNLVESLPRFNTSQGFGCILAHSMGLGKTIQVIAFIDIFLRHTTAKKVICIVPINTLQNWIAEFNMWAPPKEKPPPPNPPPPKSKDTEKKRDRSKKDKDSKKDSKTGSAESKGLVLPSNMGPMGSQMGLVNGPGMNQMSGPKMGPLSGPGMNQMGGSGMGHMGGMMSQMGAPMNQMNNPGMGPMGEMGMSRMGGPMGLDPMSNSSLGQMGGPGMGHMGGPNMGVPGMGYMGHMGGMSMHGMNHMGSSGGSYIGMPWMNSSMGQHQYGNMPSSPYGLSRQNPLGMSNMGHTNMGPPSMPPPTSMTQSSCNMSSVSSAETPTSEPMNPPSSGSQVTSVSSDNSMGSSANLMAPMSAMHIVGPGNSLSAENPMGTPPPMNNLNNSVGQGNSVSADNPMGTPPPTNQMGVQSSGNSMSAMTSGNPMSSLSPMDSMTSSSRNGNPVCPGSLNAMNMGTGHLIGGGFGTPVGSGPMSSAHINNMGGGFGNSMVNSMNSFAPMNPPVGNMMGASASMNPMSAITSMNTMDAPAKSSSAPPAITLPITMPGKFAMETSTSTTLHSSGNIPTADMQSSAADKEVINNEGIKTESETKVEAGADLKVVIKTEPKDEMDSGKEGESAAAKQDNKKGAKLGADGIEREEGDTQDMRYRNFQLFVVNDSCKTTAHRARIIEEWNKHGGALLMGYEMYRLLSSRRAYTPKPKKKKRKAADTGKEQHEVIDVDEEDKNKNLMIDIHGALVNPGPDLMICDEGHRIKNNHASISQALKQVRTRRRVVLTGYPLQNNLMEYWCMVDFVRPNFLGNKTEFSNMFERPIMNGQCQDSTAEDLKIMKHRAYVLHSLLEGFVQRRGHTVLQRALPYKHEYVFLVRMSPIQRKLYRRFMDFLEESSSLAQANNNPLKAFSVGCKIWNHPDILYKSVVLKKPVTEENDLDIESGEVSGAKKKLKKSDSSSSLASTASMSSLASSASTATAASSLSNASCVPNAAVMPSSTNTDGSDSNTTSATFIAPETTSTGVTTSVSASTENQISTTTGTSTSITTGTGTTETGIGTGPGDSGCGAPMFDRKEEENIWVGDAFEGYEPGVLEHGPKMVLLKTIIEESLKIGDKLLVFSQSLSTLDIIEEFMSKDKVPRPDMDENWTRNRSYFRLDGSTSGLERERLITEFNRPANRTAWMFLLSTRAGCLGINMIGANRVVVLDASWNPCHDCQAVCRVFRFGQNKQCHVYRLVTENTLERNIYDRQITKQGMSDRVIDEMNPDNHFSKRQLENLLKNEDKDFPYVDFTSCEECFDDPVTVNVLKKQGQWITKEPFTHESLLIDRKEMRMSRKEKMQAKEGYARDKRMNITYSRPSYAAYYPGGVTGPQMYIRRGPITRPIARVGPMMSTSVPRPSVQVVKPGVTVHQVITTTDILLPGTNTATSSGTNEPAGKIASGQKILVIKTPKGVYIRTNDGKMFAVRSKVGGADGADDSPSASTASTAASVGGTNSTTTSTATTVSSGTRVTITTPPPPRIFFKTPDGKLTEKNPNDVKGGSSLLASIYSQTSAVNALMKGNKKGQITRVIPAAPVRSLSRPRPTIMSTAAAANKATKPPVEVIVYPRSKVISPGRACKLPDKTLDSTGKTTTTLVVQPHKNAATDSPTTMRTSSSALDKVDSSSSPPNPSSQSKDSQVMKLLASDDDGEKVGRSNTMTSSITPEMKDSRVTVKSVSTQNKASNDVASSPGRVSVGSEAKQIGASTNSSKPKSKEKKDFVAPASSASAAPLSADVPKEDSSSQVNSNSSSTSQKQSHIHNNSNPASAQDASPLQQSSHLSPDQQSFSSGLPPFSNNSKEPVNSQSFSSQQHFNSQPPPQQAVNSQPSFTNHSSQQSFSSQPQLFGNQSSQTFSSQQASFNNQLLQQPFNDEPPQQQFSNQPSQLSFNNQSAQQPFGDQGQAQQFSSRSQQSQPTQMPSNSHQQQQQQQQQQQSTVQQSQQQYHQQLPDFMPPATMQTTLPATQPQFHQPWGQQQSSYMPAPGFSEYSSYSQHQQNTNAPSQQMMQSHHTQSPFPHSQHPQNSPVSSGNLMNSPFGFSANSQGPSPGQNQGQSDVGQPSRPSAFRPPSGGPDKLSDKLDTKKTPSPHTEQGAQPSQQQQTSQQTTQQQQAPPTQTQQSAQPTAQHRDNHYQENWWSSSSMGGTGSGSSNQQDISGESGGTSAATSSSTSSNPSYQSPHSAFTPTSPSYFHPGLAPFGMPPTPQSNFSMMGQGLGMPGSYPFLPSFHPGFMGSPFSQSLGGAGGASYGSGGGNGTGGYGFGGQSSEGIGSFRALLDEASDRSTTQQQSSNSTSSGMGSSSTDCGTSGLGMSNSSNIASSINSNMNGPGSPMGGGGGSLGCSSGGMNGLGHTSSMQSSTPSMYGNSPMSLGYPGLFPVLSPMANPMFMPMMPSPMMSQHYPMQSTHNPPPGPLSAMGHMVAMGSHLSSTGSGIPPSSGGGD